jgi:U3 small nucleolar RNA-associated protein 14
LFITSSLSFSFIFTSVLGSKLNLDDLLLPLASQSSALQSLKTSAKVLASESSKSKTLSAPLPQRTQERLDREVAYEQTKEEVDKWSETMNHIRMVSRLYFLNLYARIKAFEQQDLVAVAFAGDNLNVVQVRSFFFYLFS